MAALRTRPFFIEEISDSKESGKQEHRQCELLQSGEYVIVRPQCLGLSTETPSKYV